MQFKQRTSNWYLQHAGVLDAGSNDSRIDYAKTAAQARKNHALMMSSAFSEHEVYREIFDVGAAALRHAQQTLIAQARE